MWKRKDLKRKAKAAFKANYWKTVLVAIILTTVAAGGAAGISGGSSAATAGALSGSSERSYTTEADDIQDIYDEMENDLPEELQDEFEEAVPRDLIEDLPGDYDEEFGGSTSSQGNIPMWLVPFLGLFILAVVVLAVLAAVFLILPLEAGCARFFYRNLLEKAEVKEVAYGYDHGYKNVVKTLFLRDIFLFLWFLLLIIPGIIKAYEYRMIPYILAEHPDMPRKEVFYYSKMMMKGNKWKAFVLDLSFIGWWILSALTLGILSIFYVEPYYRTTCAALYQALAYGGQAQAANGIPAPAGMAPAAPAQTGFVPVQAEPFAPVNDVPTQAVPTQVNEDGSSVPTEPEDISE